MVSFKPSFEVEIRCHFDSVAQACQVLPFLAGCLDHGTKCSWDSGIYNLSLFRSGRLLRASKIELPSGTRLYLGLKDRDIGAFANIRQEIDEDFTNGIMNSEIFRRLEGRTEFQTPEAVTNELQRLGHVRFMSFGGNDVSGYDERTGVSVKLMHCLALKWPLLVELEKTASTPEAALQSEMELHELCRRFNLEGRLVRDEPPTLLYAALASRNR